MHYQAVTMACSLTTILVFDLKSGIFVDTDKARALYLRSASDCNCLLRNSKQNKLVGLFGHVRMLRSLSLMSGVLVSR